MAYWRVSDDAVDHPKFSVLSDGAFRLWFIGNCWSQKHLTDGRILKTSARRLPRFSLARATELIDVGLWHDRGDHFEVHDFLRHNDSRQHVERRRSYKRRANDLYARPELLRAVRERDGDACRYCGKPIQWHDRRGPGGATYDHIDPNGDNTIENVVVACRSCNSKKQDATPEQVGMKLLPIQNVVSLQKLAPSQIKSAYLTSPHLTSPDPKNGSSRTTRGTSPALDVETDRQLTRFGAFWALYPKKVGKGAARRIWARLKPTDALTEAICAAVEHQRTSPQWTKDGGQFIPNPATWLHQERWQDEATDTLDETEIARLEFLRRMV